MSLGSMLVVPGGIVTMSLVRGIHPDDFVDLELVGESVPCDTIFSKVPVRVPQEKILPFVRLRLAYTTRERSDRSTSGKGVPSIGYIIACTDCVSRWFTGSPLRNNLLQGTR
jgi:hypothetical protein